MKKIDKVIKGVECCILQADSDIYCSQLKCPYHQPIKDHARMMCWTKLNKDVLKLLKQQAPYEHQVTEHEAMQALKNSGWTECTYNCVPFALIKSEVKGNENN